MTKIISLLFLLLSLSIYSQDTILFRRLTHSKNCIWTKKGETKPFTGVGYKKYLNGKKSMLVNFEYGIPQGKKYQFHKNGKLKFEGQNISGDLNGTLIWYDKDGQKKSEEVYANGKNNGPIKGYYKNGVLSQIGNYKDGKLDGEYIFYSKDGNVTFKEYYSNGKRIKTSNE